MMPDLLIIANRSMRLLKTNVIQMKLYKLDLLTLLISLFILGGCQNSDSIGLDVNPKTDINGNFIDTITIGTATVREDSVVTNSLSQYPLGYLNDPLLGKTTANIALSLNLVSAGITFGTSPVLDSAVLVLHYGDEFYGESTSQLEFEVYQLIAPLIISKAYFNTYAHNFNNTLIGSKSARVNIKDSIRITEIITGKPDIQKTKAPQIRIPIGSSFINTNFLNANASNFSTEDLFRKFIKGLYLKVNQAQSTGPGGIAFFNLSDSSRLEVYYKSKNGTAIDTTRVTFPIRSSSTPVAAEFKHDYSGTPVQTQLANTSVQYDVNYMQGLAGLRTRIRFPYLDKLKSQGNITINKAELIVSVEGGTDSYKPASRLLMYRTDIANQRQLLPDFSTDPAVSMTDLSFGGFYDAANKRYKFVITTYIQDILKGKLKQYDAFLAPVSFNYNRSSGPVVSGTTAARTAIGSGKGGVTYKMKLNIVYSKIK